MPRIAVPRAVHVVGFIALHRLVHTWTFAVPNAAVFVVRHTLLFWIAVLSTLWTGATAMIPNVSESKVVGFVADGIDAARRRVAEDPAAGMVHVVAHDAGNPGSVARRFGLHVTKNHQSTAAAAADEGPSLDFPYTAPRYNEHIATITPSMKHIAHGSPTYRAQRVASADGCELLLDWAFGSDHPHIRDGGDGAAAGPPVGLIAVVPGLASDSHAAYIESFVVQAMRDGYDVVVLNSRGMKAAESKLTAPKAISGAFTDDVRHVVYKVLTRDAIRQRCGGVRTPLVLMGFSLGANVLCKFLAEEGDAVVERSEAVMAAAVSAPWRFQDAFVSMTRPAQMRVYQPALTGGLVRYLKNNEAVLRCGETGNGRGVSAWNWERAVNVCTVHHFDDEVVVPHHGFDSRDHYYREASCFPRLGAVRLPLLCIATNNDVICGEPPALAEWRALVRENPMIAYALMPGGGHLGFLMDPAAEIRGDPNPAEALVLRAANNMVAAAHTA